jgi:hypothetical protein
MGFCREKALADGLDCACAAASAASPDEEEEEEEEEEAGRDMRLWMGKRGGLGLHREGFGAQRFVRRTFGRRALVSRALDHKEGGERRWRWLGEGGEKEQTHRSFLGRPEKVESSKNHFQANETAFR